MNLRKFLGFVVLSTAFTACASDEATQQDNPSTAAPQAGRFTPVTTQGAIQSTVTPRSMDKTPVTVVVMLSGPSVADVQTVQNRRLTRSEKDQVKADRIAEQAAPTIAIAQAGGQIITSFQSAFNGIKVTIPRTQVAALKRIPGVTGVKSVARYTTDNVVSVQRIQAPFAWAGVAGVHGEGVKIGIIDTGIDYTHANFGGPGTVAAFTAAAATSTQPADPALFGPNAPKVKGGIDLVGDAYNAAGSGDALVPHPDSNPLDCGGHGSHVSGSAAGFGVLADGSTFQGPYDQLTYTNRTFGIGPGVAPKADLYAIRVFGCAGSTDVVSEALEWAVDNDMDVVNMSLGAAYGDADSADAIATDNAVKAGVTVASAAGNDGNQHYILSSPGSSSRGIAVAASSTPQTLPTANLVLPAVTGDAARTVVGIDANGATFTNSSLQVKVLRTGTAVSLGCDPNEYTAQGVTGKIVVVQRGVCARVARAIYGQKAGAAAVVMVNTDGSTPPFEDQITVNPDTGEQYTVTIPFIGVPGPVTSPSSPGSRLIARDGQTIQVNNGTPIRTGTASFSSDGPRLGDAALKPDIAAPGEAINSTLVGSGTGSVIESGTSMATPHIAGVAALGIQAHRNWKPAAIKAAIINSGNPDQLADYATHRVGTGLVNAASVAGTLAYAYGDADEIALNFGLKEFKADYNATKTIHIKNDANTAITFNVSVDHQNGSPHTLTPNSTAITVSAHGTGTVAVSLNVPAATAGNSDDFRSVAGTVTFTPASANDNRGISLKVPYFLVPRVSSNVAAKLPKFNGLSFSTASVTNASANITGTADFYAWGLESPDVGLGRIDLRAAGVQSFDSGTGDRVVVFAVNTFAGWSTNE
ncbi:MAG TPA: S8 family serine peptidase, partial [Kofleriaceae bacterium]